MNTIYLLAAVGLVIGFFVADKPLQKVVGIVIGAVIGGAVGAFLALIVAAATPRAEVVYGPATLVSMRSSDGMSGAFIFGSGSFGSETTYNFMIKKDDGSMTPRSVYANSAVAIIEDPSLTNIGYWTTTMREPNPESFLYNWGLGHKDYQRVVRQEFRVPVGTVVQTFKVQ
jgi:hypothetical protein